MENVYGTELLDKLIVGRVTPHIYAFQTGTIPNYLKVGDTYRPVSYTHLTLPTILLV